MDHGGGGGSFQYEETDHVASIADTTFPGRRRYTPLPSGREELLPLEKLALSLINMTRRLRRYFEAHPVKVITDQPIKNILSRTEASGKLAKYAVEIGTYKISFIPRNAVKGQVLADFLSDAPDGEREDEYFQSPEVSPGIDDTEAWTLYTDGAASSKGSGAGLILTGPSGVEYAYALRLTFASTNNEAEYEALLAGLRIARMMNVLRIEVKVDSKLVASQINGMYEASNGSMIKYLAKARKYISEFKTFSIENIPRGNNQKADVLSKLATVPFHNLTKEILVEVLNERSTEVQEVQTIVEEEGDNWMTPIIKYLEEGYSFHPDIKDLFQANYVIGKFTWDLAECIWVLERYKAAGQDNGQEDNPFRNGQHHMQIWSPKNHRHGQWDTTGKRPFQNLWKESNQGWEGKRPGWVDEFDECTIGPPHINQANKANWRSPPSPNLREVEAVIRQKK
ncbi:reverse transcriptase domain-containing protein [Tanacetum coccineum]